VDASTREFLAAAQAGHPVYISEVRRRYALLERGASFRLGVSVRGLNRADHAFDLVLPRFEGASAAERAFVTEYFLATLYNVLSTLGGEELRLSAEGDSGESALLARAFEREFGISLPRRDRPGYGRCVNVVERMLDAVPGAGRGGFTWALGPRLEPAGSVGGRTAAGDILAMCRDAVVDLGEKTICGVDVGGTDIKMALAVRGSIVRFKEYDWFPTSFTRVEQLIDPILQLVRLMRLDAIRARDPRVAAALHGLLEPAMRGEADLELIADVVARGEILVGESDLRFDGIGLCFPDVVVKDKIVGGEVYKTRGIRQNPAIDYEREFRRLSHLDEELRRFVSPGGVVGIINDGPMAAFTAATEIAVANARAVGDGVFAHTLGTELGTGWVTEAGEIPDIPLEVYNCIIDLGSYPERAFEPDDARSVNNFNTRLAGTLQKYTSQSGVFRLAMKYLPAASPAVFSEILERGFVVERKDPSGFFVPTAPKDMRKPFLEFLMRLPERGHDPAVERIFREVGEFLAVAWLETDFILAPKAKERILFGRLVKHRACFSLMVEGARRILPEIALSVADDELANTPFMRELKERKDYTVAQFAQAIGAVYYANYRLRELGRRGPRPGGG
jgi:hypothetical protein